MNHTKIGTGYISTIILLAGCSSAAGDSPTTSGADTPNGHNELSIEGRQFTPRPVVKSAARKVRAPRQYIEKVEKTPTEAKKRSYLDMSDEALAEAFRPLVQKGDTEYILAKPDLAMARAIKARLTDAEGRTEGFRPNGLPVREHKESKSSFAPEVIGDDNRGHLNHYQYPDATITHLFSDDGQCTATLVGPHTFLTAAHCLIADSGEWYDWPTLVPGRDTDDTTNERPYGSYENIIRSVPQQFVGSDTDWFWDFGIIVTTGIWDDPRPGDLTGWMGIIWQNSPSHIWDKWLYLLGYPGDKPYGTPWGMGRCCDQSTSLWYDDKRIFYNLDTFGGQSGAGVYTWEGNTPCIRIIHQGTWSTVFESWNTGRLIDSGMFDYYASLSPDF